MKKFVLLVSLFAVSPCGAAADDIYEEAYQAIYSDDMEKLHKLINENEIDVNKKIDKFRFDGRSLFENAVSLGNFKAVEKLHQKGGYASAEDLGKASVGYLLVGFEIYLKTVKLLLNYGASPKEEVNGESAFQLVEQFPGEWNRKEILFKTFKDEYKPFGSSIKPAKR
jgi:hypothetical protein